MFRSIPICDSIYFLWVCFVDVCVCMYYCALPKLHTYSRAVQSHTSWTSFAYFLFITYLVFILFYFLFFIFIFFKFFYTYIYIIYIYFFFYSFFYYYYLFIYIYKWLGSVHFFQLLCNPNLWLCIALAGGEHSTTTPVLLSSPSCAGS